MCLRPEVACGGDGRGAIGGGNILLSLTLATLIAVASSSFVIVLVSAGGDEVFVNELAGSDDAKGDGIVGLESKESEERPEYQVVSSEFAHDALPHACSVELIGE